MRVEVLGCKGGVFFILFCKLNTAFPLEFVKNVTPAETLAAQADTK